MYVYPQRFCNYCTIQWPKCAPGDDYGPEILPGLCGPYLMEEHNHKHFTSLPRLLRIAYDFSDAFKSPYIMHDSIPPLCHPHLIMSPCPPLPTRSYPIKSRSFLKFCTSDEDLWIETSCIKWFLCCDLLQYLPAHKVYYIGNGVIERNHSCWNSQWISIQDVSIWRSFSTGTKLTWLRKTIVKSKFCVTVGDAWCHNKLMQEYNWN